MGNQIKKIGLFSMSLLIGLISISQNTFFQSYGGNLNDYGEEIIETVDNGFIAVGATESFGNGLTDMYLIKLDSNGIVQWHKTFGGPNIDYGKDIVQTPDSGFIACGYSNSQNLDYDIFVVKINKNGDLDWSKNYGGDNWDFGNKIINSKIDSNHFYIVGQTYSFGNHNGDGFVLKINTLGDSLMMNTYGGNQEDQFEDIAQHSNGNLYCIGANNSIDQNTRLWITAIDMNGDTLWNYFSDSLSSKGKSVTLINNEIIFCGSKTPIQPTNIIPKTYYLVGGLDSNGMELFYANYNYYCYNEESCVEVIKKPLSNNYYLLSNIHYNNQNRIYSSEMNYQWIHSGSSEINGNENDIAKGLDNLKNNNGNIIIGNTYETNNGYTDIFISKTYNGIWDSIYNNNLLLTNKNFNSKKLKIYPNPTKNFIFIEGVKTGCELFIYNSYGKMVDAIIYNNSEINMETLKNGVYWLNIKNEFENIFIKIIKL